MGILDSAVLLLQAKNYSGSGAWLDESGNGHDAQFGSTGGSDTNDPQSLPWDGQNYIYFNGVAGNNVQVTLANNTVYDYTVTYEDDSTDTGTETSDGSGVVTFGDTDVKFDSLKVKLIDVYPDGGGATLALFDASLATEPFASFTDSESKLWTINRSGSGLYVVNQPSFGLHTDDYFKIPDHPDLDFAADESFTLMAMGRTQTWSQGLAEYLINKRLNPNASSPGYFMRAAFGTVGFEICDGTDESGKSDTNEPADGTLFALASVRDVAADDLEIFINGTKTGIPTTDDTTGSLANAFDLFIGSLGTTEYWDGEIMAVVVWRTALSDAEIVEAEEALRSTAITVTIGIATEIDTVPSVTPVKPIIQTIGIATETDTAPAITLIRTVGIGIATETDTALAVTVVKPIIQQIGIAAETDTALAITPVKPVIWTDSTMTTTTTSSILTTGKTDGSITP